MVNGHLQLMIFKLQTLASSIWFSKAPLVCASSFNTTPAVVAKVWYAPDMAAH